VAVVGDLQGTLFVETLLGREQNHRETDMLVRQLGGESARATVLLGDLVTWGASKKDWDRFDELAGKLPGRLLPVRGNHDYFGFGDGAEVSWQCRFPWFRKTPWYSMSWGRIGLLFVDSNLEELSPTARVAEQLWYDAVLHNYEHNPQILGTVVILHHAPFTGNPNAQSGLKALRDTFVSPFCQHPKALAMLAGHAHGYERYARACGKREVQFIVSGGGGGPRPVKTPCFDDACLAAGCCDPSSRPLHYLLLTQRPDELVVTVQAQRVRPTDGPLEVVRIPLHAPGALAPVVTTCGHEASTPVTECRWKTPLRITE
jgi:hypothetical protein